MSADLNSSLMACPECDLLQSVPLLKNGEKVHCLRCGCLLKSKRKNSLDLSIALALTGLILFILSNIFPLISLKSLGLFQESTLLSASLAMFHADYPLLAVLVFFTTFLFPLLSLSLAAFILLSIRFNRFNPNLIAPLFRFLMSIDTWGMLEIFMLSLLVAMVKLGDMADIIIGTSMYAYTGLIIVMTMFSLSLSPEDVWSKVKACRI